MKILFLTLYPSYQPSTRFRIFQFLPYLNSEHTYKVKSIMPEKFFRVFYGSPRRWKKFIFHFIEFFYRFITILSVPGYDLVFLQKGIATVNYRFLDFLLYALQKNFIFDLDDAITITAISRLTKFPLNIFDDEGQNFRLIRWAKKVFVGNEKLKKDLENLNTNIELIPTPVDTLYYRAEPNRYEEKKMLHIIWSGNKSSHSLLGIVVSILTRLSKKYQIRMIVLSDILTANIGTMFAGLNYEFVTWSYENEKKVFEMGDIGIMPMTDTLWNRRKCAFKGLLYMVNGIPLVSSPVGVVNDFIRDGENGFLANSDNEWYCKLELLIRDNLLRKKIGLNGRETVEQKFSLSKWGPCWNEKIRVG